MLSEGERKAYEEAYAEVMAHTLDVDEARWAATAAVRAYRKNNLD